MSRAAARRASYVLPLKWSQDAGLDELATYLHTLVTLVDDVIVVDGSAPPQFTRHGRSWSPDVRHLRPDPRWRCANGKVAGLSTGVLAARHERVVVADDDVRYDERALDRVLALLDEADLVRPQNIFRPLPWHARWDSARSLLNRALGADYPGTFGLRRSTFVAMGGYDGDVLFENLELVRTLRVHGGRERRAPDCFVVRRPPTVRHFLGQRVRQAYDDLAQPGRLVVLLPVLPALGLQRRRPLPVAAAALLVVVLAEVGRRRDAGREAYPASTAWFAPLWVLERASCQWLALALRLSGGVPYAGSRLVVAAHSREELRRRRLRSLVGPAGGTEAGQGVGAVAERLAPRLAAPAQGDRRASALDRVAVGVLEPERAPHDERAVAVRRDRDGVGLEVHGGGVPRRRLLIRPLVRLSAGSQR